jgi:hypothetical protein
MVELRATKMEEEDKRKGALAQKRQKTLILTWTPFSESLKSVHTELSSLLEKCFEQI